MRGVWSVETVTGKYIYFHSHLQPKFSRSSSILGFIHGEIHVVKYLHGYCSFMLIGDSDDMQHD